MKKFDDKADLLPSVEWLDGSEPVDDTEFLIACRSRVVGMEVAMIKSVQGIETVRFGKVLGEDELASSR